MVEFWIIFLNVSMLCFFLWAKWYKDYIIEKNGRRYLRHLKRKRRKREGV